MEARLEFGENCLEITNLKHFPKDKAGGSQYNTLFDLRVKSDDGKFTGVCGCEDDIQRLSELADDLQKMYELKIDEVKYRDAFGSAEIGFLLSKNGHITVSGTLENFVHSVKFEFEADQTVLPPFIGELNKMISIEK